jgi:hypothetical protein
LISPTKKTTIKYYTDTIMNLSSNAKALLVGGAAVLGGALYYRNRQNKKLLAEHKTDNVPGERESAKTRAGESMASMIQSFTPLKQFDTYVTSIRCYGNNPKRQIPVHEYIMHINEDVMQALIMDSDKAGAKIIGVEYIISERLYNQLPEDEKKYWYSHGYEIKSGAMVAPRMPMAMEHKLMSDMAPTYGKTIALWQVEKDRLPMGLPQFMFAPNSDTILDYELLRKRDRLLGIDTEKERKNREDISIPQIEDSWSRGSLIELTSQFRSK